MNKKFAAWCIAGIALAWFLAPATNRQSAGEGLAAKDACSASDLNHSTQMKAQIEELCHNGFSKSEAVKLLNEVYRTPNINPAAAVKIIITGRDLGAAMRNPDPWRK